MGALVVASANVQPHPLARYFRERLVDRGDHHGGEIEELAERPVGEGGVALEREIGGVDLWDSIRASGQRTAAKRPDT